MFCNAIILLALEELQDQLINEKVINIDHTLMNNYELHLYSSMIVTLYRVVPLREGLVIAGGKTLRKPSYDFIIQAVVNPDMKPSPHQR